MRFLGWLIISMPFLAILGVVYYESGLEAVAIVTSGTLGISACIIVGVNLLSNSWR